MLRLLSSTLKFTGKIVDGRAGRVLVAGVRFLLVCLGLLMLAVLWQTEGQIPWAEIELTRFTQQGHAFVAPADIAQWTDQQRETAVVLEETAPPVSLLCRWLGAALTAAGSPLCRETWRRLGPGNQLHDTIRQLGGGRYSVWHGYVVFSTPDHSDPRTNGVHYFVWRGESAVVLTLVASLLVAQGFPLGVGHAGYARRLACAAMVCVATLTFIGSPESIPPQLRIVAGAAFILALLRILPQPRTYRLLPGMAMLLMGFVGGSAGVSMVISAADLVPQHLAPLKLQKYLEEQRDGPPILLLVGSSLTQYGLDEKRLADDLAHDGHQVRVLRLGYGGMSSLERLYYLRRLMDAGFHPQWVLFEITAYYDNDPLLQFRHNLYSGTMIQCMDLTTALLSLRWVASTDPQPLADRLSDAYHVLTHLLLHEVHVGFFQQAESWSKVRGDSASHIPPPSPLLTGSGIAQRIDAVQQAMVNPLPPAAAPSSWALTVYRNLQGTLRGSGVANTLFYAVPTLVPNEIRYDRAFCGERDCIYPDHPAIFAALNSVSDWLDYSHLYGPGRELTTDWLAAGIIKRGLLQ